LWSNMYSIRQAMVLAYEESPKLGKQRVS